jgi:hypothetical protein
VLPRVLLLSLRPHMGGLVGFYRTGIKGNKFSCGMCQGVEKWGPHATGSDLPDAETGRALLGTILARGDLYLVFGTVNVFLDRPSISSQAARDFNHR